MKGIGSLPLPVFVFAVVMFCRYLYSKRRKKLSPLPIGYDPLDDKIFRNVSAMRTIVDAHQDFTAEVIQFIVSGKQLVKTFRLLNPGDELKIRCYNGDFKVFAFGEFMSDLIVPDSSMLPKLFDNIIPFDAYLGGRDMNLSYNENIDFASLIIFYQVDGLPPTKVNLQ